MRDGSYTPRRPGRARWLVAGALALGVVGIVLWSNQRRSTPGDGDDDPIASDATHAAATFEAIAATVEARAARARAQPTATGARPPTPTFEPSFLATATALAARIDAVGRDVPELPPLPNAEGRTATPDSGSTAPTNASALARYVAAMVRWVEEVDAAADAQTALVDTADLGHACAGSGRLVDPLEAQRTRMADVVAPAIGRIRPPAGAAAHVHADLIAGVGDWAAALDRLAARCGQAGAPAGPSQDAAGAAAVQRVRLAVGAFRRLAAMGNP
ncbi:MAG: hypothetical protein ABI780_03290 [Ardenticatenales bacterium]